MKVSSDRLLYLSRIIARKLKDSHNLVPRTDDETIRRAVMRVLSDTQKELEGIEEKVAAALAKRRNVSPRDQEFLFNQRLEEELRKHGA
ncbi:MAG TPA: DUF507 family protein [Thermoanaerobaculia bacterium]|nr:DUF507 family protein [Thermoanaerobaculia bacterium]